MLARGRTGGTAGRRTPGRARPRRGRTRPRCGTGHPGSRGRSPARRPRCGGPRRARPRAAGAATGRPPRPRPGAGRSRRPGAAPPVRPRTTGTPSGSRIGPRTASCFGVTRRGAQAPARAHDGLDDMRALGDEEPRRGLHAPPELRIAQVDVVHDAVVPGIADVLEMGHRVPLGRMGKRCRPTVRRAGGFHAVCDLREQHKLTHARTEPSQQGLMRRRYRQVHGNSRGGDLSQAAASRPVRSRRAAEQASKIRAGAPASVEAALRKFARDRDGPGCDSSVLDVRDRATSCRGRGSSPIASAFTAVNLVSLIGQGGSGRTAVVLDAVQLIADTTLVLMVLWLGKDDPNSADWAILMLPVLEGAIRFQAVGALVSWAAIAVGYIGWNVAEPRRALDRRGRAAARGRVPRRAAERDARRASGRRDRGAPPRARRGRATEQPAARGRARRPQEHQPRRRRDPRRAAHTVGEMGFADPRCSRSCRRSSRRAHRPPGPAIAAMCSESRPATRACSRRPRHGHATPADRVVWPPPVEPRHEPAGCVAEDKPPADVPRARVGPGQRSPKTRSW